MRYGLRRSRTVLACLLLLSSACASRVAREAPLDKWTPAIEGQIARQLKGDRSPELVVLLAFSGGGTRAAAFAYGVLQELAATEVMTSKGKRSLVHEVDMISSVSGGSFTSAYFALEGNGIFEDFEERFLRKNIEGALIRQLFIPTNWPKLLSYNYGRSDLAAEYYDKHVFNGATFVKLHHPSAPAVVINATELGSGLRFPFYRAYFDLICADIDKYPVSRAVAASSAVPGLFSPLTVENFAGDCGYEPDPRVVELARAKGRPTAENLEARELLEFRDREERPWLHLVDGGIADNLGLRSFYTAANIEGGLDAVFKDLQESGAHQVLLILVNSITLRRPDWTLHSAAPSLLEVVGSVSSIQLARYDIDTVDLVVGSFEKWTKQGSTKDHPISFDFIDVNFEAIEDEEERKKLNKIGTSFHLNDDEVDRLIAAGREILRESPDFQAFLERNRKLGGER